VPPRTVVGKQSIKHAGAILARRESAGIIRRGRRQDYKIKIVSPRESPCILTIQPYLMRFPPANRMLRLAPVAMVGSGRSGGHSALGTASCHDDRDSDVKNTT